MEKIWSMNPLLRRADKKRKKEKKKKTGEKKAKAKRGTIETRQPYRIGHRIFTGR